MKKIKDEELDRIIEEFGSEPTGDGCRFQENGICTLNLEGYQGNKCSDIEHSVGPFCSDCPYKKVEESDT